MRYIVKDHANKKTLLETAQYKRAEDALFRTKEVSPEEIYFVRARDGKTMFSLTIAGRKNSKKK